MFSYPFGTGQSAQPQKPKIPAPRISQITMAQFSSHPNAALLRLLSILLAIPFLSIPASARPCKTFLISSYSFSIKPLNLNPNPNPNPTNFPFYPHPSSGFVTIVTEITHQTSPSSENDKFFINRDVYPSVDRGQRQEEAPLLPFGFSSSFRDRAKDILSVAVALLFGVSCGALTAATMYFVWSLFSNAGVYGPGFDGDNNDDDDDDDDDVTPKKLGYVKIAAADSIPEPVKSVV